MSNSLAIATVTASLRNVLQSAFNVSAVDRIDGAEVSTLAPGDANVSKKGANIFLYQVVPNASLRNRAMPSRRPDGSTAQPPQVALDLHYLISFYGSDATWEPQRLLGIAVSTLNAIPVLSSQLVAQTIETMGQAPDFEFLVGSDLALGPEAVRLIPSTISLEELSKLWSILLQTRYVLSVLYVASVVQIESAEAGGPALPVLDRNISVNPVRMLSLAAIVEAVTESPHAIVAGSQIALLGGGLGLSGLAVFIDGERQSAPFALQSDSRLELVLPSGLRAGVHSLRVAGFAGASAVPFIESTLVTFALRPTIAGPIAKADVAPEPGGGRFGGTLIVPVVPRVALSQRVSLTLNQKDAAPDRAPVTIVLSRPPATSNDDSDQVELSFSAVPGGTYATRLKVGDAESLPTQLSNGSLGPEVSIP